MTIENSKQGIIKIININNNKEYIMTSIDSRVMKRYYITKAQLNWRIFNKYQLELFRYCYIYYVQSQNANGYYISTRNSQQIILNQYVPMRIKS
jgi:hypothetical protein